MQIRDFLDELRAEGSQDYLLATVLEGEQQGAALLLRGGVPVFGGSSLLAAHLPALQACTATGVLSVGGVPVFAERFGAGPRLVVCGGGHVAVAVVQIAKLLDLPVTALEDRREYADALRAAGADGLEVEVHYDPAHAWSDGAQCLTPDAFAQAMAKCRQVAWAIGREM